MKGLKHCSIFQKEKPEIQSLRERLSMPGAVDQRVRFARGLVKEATALLNCSEYQDLLDCKNCHTVARVYETAANSVIREHKKLSQSGISRQEE